MPLPGRMDTEKAKIGPELHPAPSFVINGSKFCVKNLLFFFFVLLYTWTLRRSAERLRWALLSSRREIILASPSPPCVFPFSPKTFTRFFVTLPPPRQPSSSQNSRFSFGINTTPACLAPSSKCSLLSSSAPSCRRRRIYCSWMKNEELLRP